VRPDIHTAVSFLWGKPGEDDYKKLAWVLKFLDSTVDMPLVLAADDTGKLRWWVDAKYAVHADMKATPVEPCPWEKGPFIVPQASKSWLLRALPRPKLLVCMTLCHN
jgi:hypothetical protein